MTQAEPQVEVSLSRNLGLLAVTMIGVGALLWFVPAFLGDNQAECEPQSE